MKNLYLLLAAAFAFSFTACEPEQEDISNGGHITEAQLLEKTTVSQSGNVVKCETLAPVNAKWTISGKDFLSNYATKKLKLGSHTITITALCADGTELTHDYPISVTEITDPLEKYYIYDGEDFTVEQCGDASFLRFSDNEGKHLPYISDDVYFGYKTLLFEIKEIKNSDKGIWGSGPGCPMVRIMTGWWDPVFADEVEIAETGLWELQLTEDIAKACARGNGGAGKDLAILMRRGTVTFGKVYYEE